MTQPGSHSSLDAQASQNVFSANLDSRLESRVNNIIHRLPTQPENTAAKNNNENGQRASLTQLLQGDAFSKYNPLQAGGNSLENRTSSRNALEKPETHQVYAQGTYQNGHTRSLEALASLKGYQETLNKRVEEALRRSQLITGGGPSTGYFNKTLTTQTKSHYNTSLPQSPIKDTFFESNALNHRVEEAVKRTEINLRNSGVYESSKNVKEFPLSDAKFARSANGFALGNYNNDGYSYSSKATANYGNGAPQNPGTNAASFGFNIRSLAEKTKGDIDTVFSQAMRRSQELLRRNEEYKANEFGSARKTSNINNDLRDIRKSRVEDERKSNSLYSSRVEEKVTSSLRYTHKTPPKDKELHIFHNAVRNLSPAGIYSSHFEQKPQNVDENAGDGSSYKGEVMRGKRQGRGTLTHADGSKYEGEWEDGEQNGFGTLTSNKENVIYEGEWRDGKYNGTGNLYNEDAEKLEGEFDYNDFVQLKNYWYRFEGEFENGKWNGLGTLYLTNNERFVGRFRSGKIHGTGTYYLSGGKNTTGEWRENNFVGAL